MPLPRVKRGTAALKVVSACESSDMVQAQEGELGLNQIGYGHDVNMYVCLHACTSIYAILLQCLCCLLLPLCILVSVVVFLCLSCLLVSCMPLCILVSVVVLLVSCMSACCLFVCAFMCDS